MEQPCELVVGYAEDRAVSVKAYRLLERMEKTSYFDARYVIYAEGGKIGVAYDVNEYSSLQVLEFAFEYFINNYVEGKSYIAFGSGNRIENNVNLIAKQEEIDDQKMADVWDRLFIEAGGEENPKRAKEIVDAIRKMRSMYDENVVGWYANLYDPVTGGYYISNSGRNNEGFLPDIENTAQALSWIQGTGMIDFVDGDYGEALPEWMKNQIIAFTKGLQNPKNGYFYHPQWTQEMVDNKISRRGRDLSWSTSVLKALGSAPTFAAPDGTKGDGIGVYEFWESVDWYGYMGDKSEFEEEAMLTSSLGGSVASAVASAIPVSDTVLVADDNTSYLASHENFYNYMWSLPLYQTAGISYTIGNDFNATRKQIKDKSAKLGVYTEDPTKPYYGMTLVDIWIDYFNQKVNPENGLWEKETSFAGTNGFMKLHSSYTLFGEPIPYPMEAAESVIYNLTSNEDPSHVCHNYNLWVSINGIKENVKKYGDPETRDAVLAYIDEALKENAVAMIEKTIERVSKFKKADGSFSYNANVNGGTSQGMPVSLSVNEGGINATSICMTGNFNQMLSAFGFSKVNIFGEAEWMKYCEILEGLGPITKFVPEPIIADFEDGDTSSFVAMRGAKVEVVEYNGSNQLMMSFEGLTSGWPGMDITKTLSSNSGDYMVIEGDFTFLNAQDGYYEFYINSGAKEAPKPMYFQFHITGNTVKIVQSRVSSGPSFTIGARGEQIHLRLEYFLNSKGESALRINVGEQYLGTITNNNKNASALGGAPAININRIEFAGSYLNGGKVYVDNFNFGPDFYQDKDGDEIPDAFPDNEGASGGGIVPTPSTTSPIDFEKITSIDTSLIKPSHSNYQIVEYGGSKALAVTFAADTSDEIIFYKTKPAAAGANTLVFKADITPTISGQYNINLRNSSSTRLIHFTINNQGGETGICGAYDSDGVWQPNFCEVQKTFKLRVEYGPVEKDGKTYMQMRAYVNGELKYESKLIDKYLATDENSIRSITQLRIAESKMAQGVGTLYLDNVELAEVMVLPETLPEDAVDEQGFVKFKNMESIDASLAKAKLADTLVVTEHNEKGALAFKYTKGITEEFTLYPTKNETDADLMILEANVTDSYANPRVLKIYAGSRLVYDFRINGSGGFGAESNKSWWGSGKYQKDVTFNLAITVKVTDGKVDLNLYINGEKIARPTGSAGYGVNLDLSCEADLVANISHITITDNEQPNVPDTGTVYLTDYRFVKVVDDGSFVPSAPGEGGDPEAPDVPVTPPVSEDLSSHYVSFDGLSAISTSHIKPGSTGTALVVGKLNGSDAAKLEFALDRWDEAFFYPTYKNSAANSVVVEMDVMFDAAHAEGAYATFYLRGGSSEKLYTLNVRSTAEGFSFDDNKGGSWANLIGREKFKLRIEYNKLTIDGAEKYQILLYVNGELIGASEAMDKTDKNDISQITRFDILSSKTFDGAAYIDNYLFARAERIVEFVTLEAEPEEPPHEHTFVEGKCECGATDPNYTPEGGDTHEHRFVDGKCECGATDPDYKPDEPVTPPSDKKSIKILFFGNSYSVDATKWLSRIFLEAGYEDVIVGNVATGGCCINEHWSFLDGIEGNEPNGGSFFYTKYVNGKEVPAEDDYAFAIGDEEWDIISLQHAPDELKQVATYSHLQDFLDYILARVTNPDVKLVFHMIWAHNNVSDIKGLYNSILEITDKYVTVKTEFDGLVPSATMIEYLRDAGLTNATMNDDGSWTAGDISRDWGHLNYGLGRYAVALLYYAYLTGESIDDFDWVPTADMVAGTSEAQGFAEITPEKLALIKEAIRYALANPYGEDYEPKNGDGIGFPNCEMGGGNADGTPLTPDKDGYISFEDMTADGSLLVIPTVGGSLKVSEKDGSDMLEFVYSSTSTEQYKLLPTLSEAGANIMILEADIIDSYGGARTLKIMAGSRLVYDFRINGTGGFGAESNDSWWGGGHYTANTKYNLKITVEVTDGKVDLNMYINGNKLTRPTGSTGYGVNLDLSCEDNLVELITHIDIIDGAKIAGSVYIDNYRFVKLATSGDDTPGEGGGDPVTPPEGGDSHEHEFVSGKCECGAEDPDYKPAAESDYGTPMTFEGIESFDTKKIKTNDYTGGAALVTHNGSKVFALTCTPDTNDEFFVYRTESDDADGDTYVFEADITADLTSGENVGGYNISFRGPSISGTISKLYTLTINSAGGAYDTTSNSVKDFTPVREAYKLRVEYGYVTVEGVVYIQVRAYVNGELKLTSKNIEKTDDNEPQDVSLIQVLEANKPVEGTIYIDNIVSRVVRINTEEVHEHEFVAGKCECGETDPEYVAPEVNAEAITFEDIASLAAVGITVSSEESITVSPLGEGKALKVDFASGTTEKITITPNSAAGADKFVFEFDLTNLDAADAVSTDKAQYDIRFYSTDGATAKNGTLYDFGLNGPTFMCEGGGQWLGNVLPADSSTCRVRIELWVEGEALCVKALVNGVENTRLASVYGKTYTHVASGMSANTISSIYKVEIVDSRVGANGTVYFDNIYCAAIKTAE